MWMDQVLEEMVWSCAHLVCEQRNVQGAYGCTGEVKEEVKCIKAITEADTEGRLSYSHVLRDSSSR